MASVNAVIRVNIDASAANAGLASMAAQMQRFNKGMIAGSAAMSAAQVAAANRAAGSLNRTGQWIASTGSMMTATGRMAQQFDKGTAKSFSSFRQNMAMNNRSMTAASGINQLAAARVRALQTQYVALGREVDGVQKVMKAQPTGMVANRAWGSSAEFAAQRAILFRRNLTMGANSMINWGKNTQWAGRQMMVGMGIPMGLAAMGAVRSFKEIEAASISFKRVYGDATTSAGEKAQMLGTIQSGVAQEMTKYGIAVSDTLDVAAKAAATGQKGDALIAATRETMRVATLGNMDYMTALEGTIATQTAFGVSAKGMTRVTDFMNAAENQTILSMEDMSKAIPRVAPVIRGLGGDVEDLGVLMTALRAGGVTAEQGANALKSGLASLINPTSTATEAMKSFGIPLDKIVQANKGDLIGTVEGFGKALAKLPKFQQQQALESLFGKYQYARMGALFRNINKKQAQETAKLSKESNANLAQMSENELGQIADSNLTKFEGAVERLKAAAAPLGGQIMGFLAPIIDFGAKIVDFFATNDVAGQVLMWGAAFAGLAGIGTMLTGVFANFFGTMIKGGQFMHRMGRGMIGRPLPKYETIADLEATAAQRQLAAAADATSASLYGEKGAVTQLAAALNAMNAELRESVGLQAAAAGGVVTGGAVAATSTASKAAATTASTTTAATTAVPVKAAVPAVRQRAQSYVGLPKGKSDPVLAHIGARVPISQQQLESLSKATRTEAGKSVPTAAALFAQKQLALDPDQRQRGYSGQGLYLADAFNNQLADPTVSKGAGWQTKANWLSALDQQGTFALDNQLRMMGVDPSDDPKQTQRIFDNLVRSVAAGPSEISEVEHLPGYMDKAIASEFGDDPKMMAAYEKTKELNAVPTGEDGKQRRGVAGSLPGALPFYGDKKVGGQRVVGARKKGAYVPPDVDAKTQEVLDRAIRDLDSDRTSTASGSGTLTPSERQAQERVKGSKAQLAQAEKVLADRKKEATEAAKTQKTARTAATKADNSAKALEKKAALAANDVTKAQEELNKQKSAAVVDQKAVDEAEKVLNEKKAAQVDADKAATDQRSTATAARTAATEAETKAAKTTQDVAKAEEVLKKKQQSSIDAQDRVLTGTRPEGHPTKGIEPTPRKTVAERRALLAQAQADRAAADARRAAAAPTPFKPPVGRGAGIGQSDYNGLMGSQRAGTLGAPNLMGSTRQMLGSAIRTLPGAVMRSIPGSGAMSNLWNAARVGGAFRPDAEKMNSRLAGASNKLFAMGMAADMVTMGLSMSGKEIPVWAHMIGTGAMAIGMFPQMLTPIMTVLGNPITGGLAAVAAAAGGLALAYNYAEKSARDAGIAQGEFAVVGNKSLRGMEEAYQQESLYTKVMNRRAAKVADATTSEMQAADQVAQSDYGKQLSQAWVDASKSGGLDAANTSMANQLATGVLQKVISAGSAKALTETLVGGTQGAAIRTQLQGMIGKNGQLIANDPTAFALDSLRANQELASQAALDANNAALNRPGMLDSLLNPQGQWGPSEVEGKNQLTQWTNWSDSIANAGPLGPLGGWLFQQATDMAATGAADQAAANTNIASKEGYAATVWSSSQAAYYQNRIAAEERLRLAQVARQKAEDEMAKAKKDDPANYKQSQAWKDAAKDYEKYSGMISKTNAGMKEYQRLSAQGSQQAQTQFGSLTEGKTGAELETGLASQRQILDTGWEALRARYEGNVIATEALVTAQGDMQLALATSGKSIADQQKIEFGVSQAMQSGLLPTDIPAFMQNAQIDGKTGADAWGALSNMMTVTDGGGLSEALTTLQSLKGAAKGDAGIVQGLFGVSSPEEFQAYTNKLHDFSKMGKLAQGEMSKVFGDVGQNQMSQWVKGLKSGSLSLKDLKDWVADGAPKGDIPGVKGGGVKGNPRGSGKEGDKDGKEYKKNAERSSKGAKGDGVKGNKGKSKNEGDGDGKAYKDGANKGSKGAKGDGVKGNPGKSKGSGDKDGSAYTNAMKAKLRNIQKGEGVKGNPGKSSSAGNRDGSAYVNAMKAKISNLDATVDIKTKVDTSAIGASLGSAAGKAQTVQVNYIPGPPPPAPPPVNQTVNRLIGADMSLITPFPQFQQVNRVMGFDPSSISPAPVDQTVYRHVVEVKKAGGVVGLADGGLPVPENKFKRRGSRISGPGGPTDDKIPAMLSSGEFVVKASSVRKYGTGFLGRVNNGMVNTDDVAHLADGSSDKWSWKKDVMKPLVEAVNSLVRSTKAVGGKGFKKGGPYLKGALLDQIGDDPKALKHFLKMSEKKKIDFLKKIQKAVIDQEALNYKLEMDVRNDAAKKRADLASKLLMGDISSLATKKQMNKNNKQTQAIRNALATNEGAEAALALDESELARYSVLRGKKKQKYLQKALLNHKKEQALEDSQSRLEQQIQDRRDSAFADKQVSGSLGNTSAFDVMTDEEKKRYASGDNSALTSAQARAAAQKKADSFANAASIVQSKLETATFDRARAGGEFAIPGLSQAEKEGVSQEDYQAYINLRDTGASQTALDEFVAALKAASAAALDAARVERQTSLEKESALAQAQKRGVGVGENAFGLNEAALANLSQEDYDMLSQLSGQALTDFVNSLNKASEAARELALAQETEAVSQAVGFQNRFGNNTFGLSSEALNNMSEDQYQQLLDAQAAGDTAGVAGLVQELESLAVATKKAQYAAMDFTEQQNELATLNDQMTQSFKDQAQANTDSAFMDRTGMTPGQYAAAQQREALALSRAQHAQELESRNINDINEAYDEQTKLLDKIAQAQQIISNLEKGRLAVASALSQGDIAGAASAMQDQRDAQAQASMDIMKQALTDDRDAKVKKHQDEIDRLQKDIDASNDRLWGLQDTYDEIASQQTTIAANQSAAYEKANLQIKTSARYWEKVRAKIQETIDLINSIPPFVDPTAPAAGTTGAGEMTAPGFVSPPAPAPEPAPTPPPSQSENDNTKWAKFVEKLNKLAQDDDKKFALKKAVGGGTPMDKWHDKFKALKTANKDLILSVMDGGNITPNERKKIQDAPGFYATGGLVPGTGSRDTVNAMLTPGEFVVRKDRAKKFGPILSRINSSASPSDVFGAPSTANVTGVTMATTNISLAPPPVVMAAAPPSFFVSDDPGSISPGYAAERLMEYNTDSAVYNVTVNASGSNLNAEAVANIAVKKMKELQGNNVRQRRM